MGGIRKRVRGMNHSMCQGQRESVAVQEQPGETARNVRDSNGLKSTVNQIGS